MVNKMEITDEITLIIAKKGADIMLKEVYDLAEKYGIHPDVALDIYTHGFETYEKILNEYLKARKQKE